MGQSTGITAYPDYITNFHSKALTGEMAADEETPYSNKDFLNSTNIADIIDAILGGVPLVNGNPYLNFETYDPTDDISEIEERLEDYLSAASFDELALWEAYVDKASTKAVTLLPDSLLSSMVSEFEAQEMSNLARATNRITAGFDDINAVTSTAFPVGLALAEIDAGRNIARFKAERAGEIEKTRALFVLQSVDNMTRQFSTRMTMGQNGYQLQAELAKIKITAQHDYDLEEATRDVEAVLWPITVYERGLRTIGALGGVSPVQEKPSAITSALTGIMSGASTALPLAMALGSMEIGIPLVIAASLLGGLSGFLG